MKRYNPMLALFAALVISMTSVVSLAQQTLDRTKVPAPGPNPVLKVPTWTRTQLSNGATLIVSERHSLPLITFNLTFVGVANQFEPVNKRGVASLTASMLTPTGVAAQRIRDSRDSMGRTRLFGRVTRARRRRCWQRAALD